MKKYNPCWRCYTGQIGLCGERSCDYLKEYGELPEEPDVKTEFIEVNDEDCEDCEDCIEE